MSAWAIHDWLTRLDVDTVIVENVPEFTRWGPLLADGRPDPRGRGKFFEQWFMTFGGLGIRGRVAAPQRRRLRRRHQPGAAVHHGPAGRTRYPLAGADAPASHRRAQRRADVPRPAAVARCRGNHRLDRHRPVDTRPPEIRQDAAQGEEQTAHRPGIAQEAVSPKRPVRSRPCSSDLLGLCAEVFPPTGPTRGPFVLGQQSCAAPRGTGRPLPTIATAGAISLVQPMVLQYYGTSNMHCVSRPLATVTAGVKKHALVATALVELNHGNGQMGPDGDRRRTHPVEAPLHTITTNPGTGLATASFLTPNFGESAGQKSRYHRVDHPLPTVTSRGRVQPGIRRPPAGRRRLGGNRGTHGKRRRAPAHSADRRAAPYPRHPVPDAEELRTREGDGIRRRGRASTSSPATRARLPGRSETRFR